MTHMTSIEDITIPVPWGHISAKWWGSRNRQPFICIHGWQDNAATFDTLIPLLPENFSYLCIDLPGHGRSAHFPEGMPYNLIFDGVIVIRRVLKHFGWSEISVIGHSLGGLIGFLYASVYPDQVNTLISLDVVAPIFKFVSEEFLPKLGNIIDKFLYYDDVKDSKDLVQEYNSMIDVTMRGHGGKLTKESCEQLMTRGMYSRGNGKYSFSRDNRVKVGWMTPTSPDFIRNCAKTIKCRYLNIKATPYDLDTWPMYKEICDIIAVGAREFKLTFVEGTHHVHLNEPEKVSPHISEFLLFSNGEPYGENEN